MNDQEPMTPWQADSVYTVTYHRHMKKIWWYAGNKEAGTQGEPPADVKSECHTTALEAVAQNAAQGKKRLVEALECVLKRDSQFSNSGMPNDCNCSNLSRKAEQEYEQGICPHQMARAALAEAEGKKEKCPNPPCTNPMCIAGNIYDDDGQNWGPCPTCKGTGEKP